MANFSWLWQSWWFLAPAPCVAPILALMAVVCGIIVGNERQRREKPAGLRTLSLVSLGSAVFTMMSFAFTSTTGDSGRVAAQIVAGIGFLGAGVILHGKHVITGMTTAALIWMTAAIGMAVGGGYAIPALGLSIIVNRLLVGIFMYETRFQADLRDTRILLEFVPKNGITRVRLERILGDHLALGNNAQWSQDAPETGKLELNVRMSHAMLYELLDAMVELPEVTSIQQHHGLTPTP